MWIAQGATLDVPLAAKVLVNGVGVSGRTVNYGITQGAGNLSSLSALSNTSGIATVNLHLANLASEVDVSACVSPQNSPCRIFHVFAVSSSSLRFEAVSGSLQFVAVGQSFQPVTVRLLDSVGNPVGGVNVTFQLLISRDMNSDSGLSIGDTTIQHHPLPVILSSSKATLVSDANGLASILPSNAGISGAIVIQGNATSGTASLPFLAQSFGQ